MVNMLLDFFRTKKYCPGWMGEWVGGWMVEPG